MSNTPQAIERSVLERKERDELNAIAEAMGVKPSARASKATIIDHILREAGVEVAGADPAPAPQAVNGAEPVVVARPRRNRAPRAEAVVGTNGAEPAAEGYQPQLLEAKVEAPPEAAAPSAEVQALAEESRRSVPTQMEQSPSSPPQVNQGLAEHANANAGNAQGRTDERPRERERDRDQNRGHQQREARGGGQPYDNAGGDPGNRRGRRRRGRERGERDIQPERAGQEVAYSGEPIAVEGLLDLREEGYGFLRAKGYLANPTDVYVSVSQVRRFGLRKGDFLNGASRPAGSSEKYPALLRIDTVNAMSVEEARSRPRFEDLTPLFPDQKLRLEVAGDSNNMVSRIVDLISPIGKGQRGLIVSPPKAGKTTVLKQIAHSIEANNPDVHLMVLLVDERPEEVTDMRRSVKGEVIASTFDRPSDEHTQVSELAIERAKRLVELGRDVVIVLDGITRLARAYNLAAPATGRIMSGGIDTGALYPPKKFFGAARNLEEGGSLTILATALIETGSKMDEVIFEEFKGTGNMELRLDRRLAERRIYPALEVNASSTRHEELLFERGQLPQVWKLRRVLNALEPGAGLELLMDKIRTTKSNDEFLAEIAKAPAPAGA
ncbi:MAG: transcription termination factor Rho [Acidimicrobiales bacterium]